MKGGFREDAVPEHRSRKIGAKADPHEQRTHGLVSELGQLRPR